MRKSAIIDKVEVKDILISVIVISLAFTLARIGGLFTLLGENKVPFDYLGLLFVISVFTVGIGFVLHEMAHKFMAMRFGCWAAFRAWPTGLQLALLTSIFGFVFAAPGATYIDPTYARRFTPRENGIISIVGPITNVVIAILFVFLSPLLIALLPGTVGLMLVSQGIWINLWLALFNMLPFGPLDGKKVMAWSFATWALVTFGIFAMMFL